MSTKSAPRSQAIFAASNVFLNERFHFGIADNLLVAGHVEILVENWMAISHARLSWRILVRLTEAAGMGELKSDDQIVGCFRMFSVRVEQALRICAIPDLFSSR